VSSNVTIAFQGMPRSAAQEHAAGELAHRLQSFSGNIKHCLILLESVLAESSREIRYNVKIELSLPGARLHADSVQAGGGGHVQR
jgi:hypothetical protein